MLERWLARRAGCTHWLLNRWGVPTINSYATASVCADKLLTSLALARHNVPQPATRVAFTPESTMTAIEKLGYPAVLKPVTGSWGRLLARVTDANSAESIIEHRQTWATTISTYYMQEYVDKPGRDIRGLVVGDSTICAIYRTSPHWITNTARGGQASNCPVTPEWTISVCGRRGQSAAACWQSTCSKPGSRPAGQRDQSHDGISQQSARPASILPPQSCATPSSKQASRK